MKNTTKLVHLKEMGYKINTGYQEPWHMGFIHLSIYSLIYLTKLKVIKNIYKPPIIII